MPDITAVHLAVFAILFAVGVVLGWFLRSDRSAREKIAINAGWQEQLEARQGENDRLTEQNKSLMQQVSQYQASQSDSMRRAKELAASLKDAFERRDELQRQIKDIRGNLESAILQCNRLQTDIETRDVRGEAATTALREKDNKIFKLSRELGSWQNRVPPLVEKFRQRDREARELQIELDKARDRIVELEILTRTGQTRIEPVDRDSLAEGLDASNDQFEETSEHELAGLQDQVVEDSYRPGHGNGGTGFFEGDFSGHTLHDPSQPGPDHSAVPPQAPVQSPPDSFLSAGLRDDLQKIKGVGPAIERTLHDLGIFRFDQIARISEYEIDRIAERLKGFRSRIYREDWIGQARILQFQKDSDPS